MASSTSTQDQSKLTPETMPGNPPEPGHPPGPGHPHGHSGGYPSGNQGYPPPGYPIHQSYPPPYPAYPNHPNPYPYTAPPPAAYYASQHNSLPSHHEQSGGLTFFRTIFLMMIILILATFFLSLITLLFFGSDIPSFKVESLSVPVFNVTNSTLDAKWEANVTVKNMNKKFDVVFYHIDASVIHKTDILAIGLVDSLQVGRLKEGSIISKLVAQNGIKEERMRELSKERSAGMVSFNLKMGIGATYISGSMWKKQIRMRVFFVDLKVEFNSATGVGALVPGGQKDCFIYE